MIGLFLGPELAAANNQRFPETTSNVELAEGYICHKTDVRAHDRASFVIAHPGSLIGSETEEVFNRFTGDADKHLLTCEVHVDHGQLAICDNSRAIQCPTPDDSLHDSGCTDNSNLAIVDRVQAAKCAEIHPQRRLIFWVLRFICRARPAFRRMLQPSSVSPDRLSIGFISDALGDHPHPPRDLMRGLAKTLHWLSPSPTVQVQIIQRQSTGVTDAD